MKHALAKFYGSWYDADQLEDAMRSVIEELGLEVLDSTFHTNLVGVSGVLLLLRSHFAAYSVPEQGYAMIDLCGEEPQRGIQLLASHLGAHFEMMEVDREMNYVSS